MCQSRINNVHNLFCVFTDEHCFGFATPEDIANFKQGIDNENKSLIKEQLHILSSVERNSNPVIFKLKFK